jgi:molybdopterin molybdotransferase
VKPLEVERVEVGRALGRALAEPVIAGRTLPPWDNSAMDGYALRAVDGAAGATLRVTSTVHAGDRPTTPVGALECARIMTGAPLPPGADSVVMQEKVRLEAHTIVLEELVKPGANVRRRGEDVEAGATLLPAGRVVGAAEAGAIWGQAITTIPVRRRPRVAIASSGDELCDVWSPQADRIVDTNTPVIAELVRLAGGEPTILGRAADRLEAVTELFARGLSGFDALVTVSGASVGDKDFTRQALESLGVEMDFWKVAMKPGKPLAVGRRGATAVFGLPGNPVSAMVTFELFVRPALRAMQGLPPALPLLPGRVSEGVKKAAGLRLFVRATTQVRDGELWATPLSSQSSGALTSAAGATHLISIGPDETQVISGARVELIPLAWGA